MRIVWKFADIAWISRRKSWAAKRPSPSAFGGVLDVAARRVPPADELAQQPGHHHRVARVVELELVDAEQVGAAEELDGVLVAERADERGVLDERAEVLPARRHRVVDRREQVRLADAEAAVEVDAGLELGAALLRDGTARRAAPAPAARERDEQVLRLLLRRERGIRAIRVEGRIVELRRRHQGGDHLGPRSAADRSVRWTMPAAVAVM